MSSEDFLEEAAFVLGTLTRGQFPQVEAVGFGQEQEKESNRRNGSRCRNSMSEGGKVRVFTVQ